MESKPAGVVFAGLGASSGRQGSSATYMPGWCNESQIFLWTAAHGAFRDDICSSPRKQPGMHGNQRLIGNLCCGSRDNLWIAESS